MNFSFKTKILISKFLKYTHARIRWILMNAAKSSKKNYEFNILSFYHTISMSIDWERIIK